LGVGHSKRGRSYNFKSTGCLIAKTAALYNKPGPFKVFTLKNLIKFQVISRHLAFSSLPVVIQQHCHVKIINNYAKKTPRCKQRGG